MIAIFPEITKCVSMGDPEQLAMVIRKYFCDKNALTPKIDLELVFKNIGIQINRMHMDCFGTLLAKDKDGCFSVTAVIGTRSLSSEEDSFLLAHMLGHFLFDIQPHIAKGDWTTSGLREIESPLNRYCLKNVKAAPHKGDQKKEILADAFAASLLAPQSMLLKAAEKSANTEQIARLFGVTCEFVKTRTQQSCATTERVPLNFHDAENRLREQTVLSTSTKQNVPLVNSAPQSPEGDLLHSSLQKCAPATPRSFAVSSYDQMQKKADKAQKEPKANQGSEKALGQNALKRLRELAKKIDGNVEI